MSTMFSLWLHLHDAWGSRRLSRILLSTVFRIVLVYSLKAPYSSCRSMIDLFFSIFYEFSEQKNISQSLSHLTSSFRENVLLNSYNFIFENGFSFYGSDAMLQLCHTALFFAWNVIKYWIKKHRSRIHLLWMIKGLWKLAHFL